MKNMDNRNIYLKNEILDNKNLSANAISVYIALRSVYLNWKDEYYINSDLLYYELFQDGKVNRYAKTNIKDGLKELIELDLITIAAELSKDSYILNLKGINIPNGDFYTIIESDEILKILTISKGKDSFKLLSYFVRLIKSIDGCKKNSKELPYVGYMSVDHLANISGISKTTLTSYNKILEDNNLIYTYHHDKTISVVENGVTTFAKMPNHYGRYRDKDDIKSYAKEYEKNWNDRIIKSKNKINN